MNTWQCFGMPAPGSAAAEITRGVCRLFADRGFASLPEFKLASGRRVDVAGLDKAGRFAVAEVKSSIADFRADGKWEEYLDFADLFYFAVGPEFPQDLIPQSCGLIVADAFQGAIVRPAVEHKINPARRRHQVLRFALTGARRLAV